MIPSKLQYIYSMLTGERSAIKLMKLTGSGSETGVVQKARLGGEG